MRTYHWSAIYQDGMSAWGTVEADNESIAAGRIVPQLDTGRRPVTVAFAEPRGNVTYFLSSSHFPAPLRPAVVI